MVRTTFARARSLCLVIGLVAPLLAACGGNEDVVTPSTTPTSTSAATAPGDSSTVKPVTTTTKVVAPTTTIVSGPLAGRAKPDVHRPVDEAVTTLQIEDMIVGTGPEAVTPSLVEVHYVGVLVDGTEFDSSWGKATPFNFAVGSGQVIKGWDQGVAGMRVGGRRRLVIPPDLAYGATAKTKIPANSTLIFVVDLAKVTPEPDAVLDPTPAAGLTSQDLDLGSGPAVALGDTVTINFVLVSATTGKKLYSSWRTGRTSSVKMGDDKAIKGWDQGIIGMKVGGRRRLSVPPALAYGEKGNADVGPNETLVYIIDVVSRAA